MASSNFPVINGKPAWRVKVETPGGFRVGDHSNEFRLFHLPGAALLSWVLKLVDESSESLIVHHVFDLADPEMTSYLGLVATGGRLLLVFEGEGGFEKEISVGSAKLKRLVDQGVHYNGRLSTVNGPEALRVFLDLFNPVFREAGAEAAWSAVDKQVGFVSISKPVITPSTSDGSGSAEVGGESQTSRISGGKAKAARPEESESETSIHDADFGPLLSAARPEMYRRNAFRIAELPVNVPNKDLDRRQRMIEGAMKMGAAIQRGPYRALPFADSASPEFLGEAMSRLREPVQRIIDELFWFWPSENPAGGVDPPIALLSENQVRPAFEAWKKQGATGDPKGIATHNLAVLSHLTALELEEPDSAKALKDVKPEEAGGFWSLAYRTWKLILETEPFWKLLENRIGELNDPRLTTAASRRIRRTLPLALLSINARLAIQAAEKGDAAASDRHRQAMTHSGFDQALVERALRGAVDPLRDRITTLCSEAERDFLDDGEKGLEVGARLLKQAEPLLAAVDSLFPAGNSAREDAHDAVAARVRSAIVKYGNVKDLDNDVLKMLKMALGVAEGASARQAIESDMETVKRLIKEAKENEVYLKCWFCKSKAPDLKDSASVAMYGNVTREWRPGGARVKWQQNTLKVPRCPDCKRVHAKVVSWGTRFGAIGVALVILSALVILAKEPDAKDKMAGLGCVGLVACIIVGLIFNGIGKAIGRSVTLGGAKPESEKMNFPSILEAKRLGWSVGTKPAGVQ
jgi:hypothetical protein